MGSFLTNGLPSALKEREGTRERETILISK
jgi:hypothetical protein